MATSKTSTNTLEAAVENNSSDTNLLPTDSNIEGAGGANGTKTKTALVSKSK
jgi:hypothetical protein